MFLRPLLLSRQAIGIWKCPVSHHCCFWKSAFIQDWLLLHYLFPIHQLPSPLGYEPALQYELWQRDSKTIFQRRFCKSRIMEKYMLVNSFRSTAHQTQRKASYFPISFDSPSLSQENKLELGVDTQHTNCTFVPSFLPSPETHFFI